MSVIEKAKAIMINDRYFHDFGKKRQVLTAWSVGGAKLFVYADTLDAVLKKLDKKRKTYQVVDVAVNKPSGVSIKEFYQLYYCLHRTIFNIHKTTPSIGLHQRAYKISSMSALVALLESEFSPKDVGKIKNLVSSVQYSSNEVCPLLLRLSFYRQNKQIKARAENEKFCEDIPF
ncbi:hypothetical protein [Aliivibrio logei]|uniref:Uncharacterized protein n=1 Tax=Aliivibrio logei 5S-186 TaxID=626086 RepID=A0ABX3ARP5_ALILO|nr:hypothetical protein [Aliivibrio logei]OEF10841.1 hypothetical protein A1Q5_01550 [Aliivibrio logei 5S-186]